MIGELLMVKVEAMSEKAVSQATGSVAVSEGEGDRGFLPFQKKDCLSMGWSNRVKWAQAVSLVITRPIGVGLFFYSDI
jgi:uncharacterized protein YhfF